jgi:tRNA (guanine37-N1)-methyltransferase
MTGMRIDVVSIFPDYLAPLKLSLLGKAAEDGLLDVHVHDLRAFTTDKHRTVDDTPYGGGPGMVMKPEPWGLAIDAVEAAAGGPPVWIVPTPSGEPFDQDFALELSALPRLAFACGRYEGIDRRVINELGRRGEVREVSIGDYVLAGGEVAVLVMVEAIARLIPGILGNPESVADDSFAPGAMESLLEGPVYTKPATWRGLDVPEVLLSGNHAAIARWRRNESLRRTAETQSWLLNFALPDTFDVDDEHFLGSIGWYRVGGRWVEIDAESEAEQAAKAADNEGATPEPGPQDV